MRLVTVYMYSCKLLCGLYCLQSGGQTVYIYTSTQMCMLHMQVQIIQLDEDRGEFVLRATFDHPYPTTKIMWIPDQVTGPKQMGNSPI